MAIESDRSIGRRPSRTGAPTRTPRPRSRRGAAGSGCPGRCGAARCAASRARCRLTGSPGDHGPAGLLAVPARPRASPRGARRASGESRRLVEEVAQRALADLAHPLGGELEAPAGAVDEPAVAQRAQRARQALDVARGVVAEVPAHRLDVDLGQRLGRRAAPEELLEAAQLAEAARPTSAESAKEVGSPPRMRCARPQSRSGVASRRFDTRRVSDRSRSMSPISESKSPRSSACCSADIELNIASAAAARSASIRTTSSRLCAPSKCSPQRSMKDSKLGSSSSPRRSCSIIVESASIIARRSASASGSGSAEEPARALEEGVDDVALELGDHLVEPLARVRRDELVVAVAGGVRSPSRSLMSSRWRVLASTTSRVTSARRSSPEPSASASSSASSASSRASMASRRSA